MNHWLRGMNASDDGPSQLFAVLQCDLCRRCPNNSVSSSGFELTYAYGGGIL